MKCAVLTIRRRDLESERTCRGWVEFFDEVCAERDTDHATGSSIERGPLMRRRDGSTFRAADRLRIELTPVAQIWLSLPRGLDGSAWRWLRARGVVGAVSAPNAGLQGANLRQVYLRGADLQGADFRDADLQQATLCDANLQGADLQGADLRNTNLKGASLQGADLEGAKRLSEDHAIQGWAVRDGRLECSP